MENLFLDFNHFENRVALGTFEKCDSLTLNIKLDEKDYAGCKFKILGEKIDKNVIEQNIKEQEIDLESKTIKTVLDNQFTTKSGIVRLEINIIKEGKENTTKEAFFVIRDTINTKTVESTSIIPTLQGIESFINDTIPNLEKLEQAGKDITTINEEFKKEEVKRQANELLRVGNEEERVRAEKIRLTEEENRVEAEIERQQEENIRKENEVNRKLNENTRKTNENARVEAELSRQAIFEENESIRNENENLRIEAEKKRELHFSTSNRGETEREEAEKVRVENEEIRVKAETERVKAEEIRQKTYTNFNDSEVERKQNEVTRVENEKARVEAENGRNDIFNASEAERNDSFLESDSIRNDAFKKAQEQRDLAYLEEEKVRAEAFKVSEDVRMANETERLGAEELRKSEEKTRVENEKVRVEEEKTRVKNEQVRVEVEKTRASAEELRVQAEEERIIAEAKREEGFSKYDSKLNSNTFEIESARTATTGENFNSLDERIDCEVERLIEKVEVSMLEQEEKREHYIDNTVSGITDNMVVRGNTIQNLILTPVVNKTFVANSTNYIHEYRALKKKNTKYTLVANISKNTLNNNFSLVGWGRTVPDNSEVIKPKTTGIIKRVFVTNDQEVNFYLEMWAENTEGEITIDYIMIFEGEPEWYPDTYFEGIKSFGEEENIITLASEKYLEPLSENTEVKEINLKELGFENGLMSIKDQKDELDTKRNIAIKRIGKRPFKGGDLALENVITDSKTTFYILDEPVETNLQPNLNLKTYEGNTRIRFENFVQGTSRFSVPVNTAANISSLNKKTYKLESESKNNKTNIEGVSEGVLLTRAELRVTQSAVDFLLFNSLNVNKSKKSYNKVKGGENMGAYLAMRIMRGMLDYDVVIRKYGEFKEDIDTILRAEGFGHLITS